MSVVGGWKDPWVRLQLEEWERTGVLELRTSRKILAISLIGLFPVPFMASAACIPWAQGDLVGAVLLAATGGMLLTVSLFPVWLALQPWRVRVTATGIETRRYRVDWSDVESVGIYAGPHNREVALRVTPQVYGRIAHQQLRWPRWYAKANTRLIGEPALLLPPWLGASVESAMEVLQIVHSERAGRDPGGAS